MCDCFKNIIDDLWPSSPPLATNFWLIAYLGSLLTALPSCFASSIGSFVPIAWASALCLIVAAGSLLTHFFRTELSHGQFTRSQGIVWFNPNFERIMQGFGHFNTAFVAHPFVAPITEQMHSPTRDRILRLTWAVNIPGAVFIYAIALIGFLCFGGVEDDENVLFAFDGRAPQVMIGRIAIRPACLHSSAQANSPHPSIWTPRRQWR
jgi:hypothetical protein